jgi:hypothetical protein
MRSSAMKEMVRVLFAYLLLDVQGMDLWSQNNGADYIIDLHTTQNIPKQLVIGSKVGFNAVFMKLQVFYFHHLECWSLLNEILK